MSAPDLVFNDRSTSPLAPNQISAGERMTQFLQVLRVAPTHGFGPGLRISEEFYLHELADDFPIVNWVDSPTTTVEERGFLLTLADKAPFLLPSDTTALAKREDCSVSFCGEQSAAFEAAYLLDSALVSLHHTDWLAPTFAITIEALDDEDEILIEEETLPNFATLDHYTHHQPWLTARFRSLTSPAELWERRAELFPHLDLSSSVEKQLLEQSAYLHRIVTRLHDMERVAAAGITPFDAKAFARPCRPTTSGTRDQFESRYTFSQNAGETHFCGWHLNLTKGKRIYFTPVGSQLFIGHIGEHLPTKKYPS